MQTGAFQQRDPKAASDLVTGCYDGRHAIEL